MLIQIVDHSPRALISDFNYARMETLGGNNTTSSQTVTRRARWMAPELLREPDAKPTLMSDIWSMGMLFCEVQILCNALDIADHVR